DSPVVSTIAAADKTGLRSTMSAVFGNDLPALQDLQFGKERYVTSSVRLGTSSGSQVRLTVLKSYDQATGFLRTLNRLLLGIGLLAIAGGSLLVYLISHTFTRPLENLVAGVRALEEGNFVYPTEVRGTDEVAQLT